MAHNRFDSLISGLADAFAVVGNAMLKVVRSFVGGGASFSDANAAIDEAAGHLHDEVARWVDETLPQIYADGVRQSLESPQTPDVAPGGLAMGVHDQTLATYQDELTGRLALATANVSEDAKSALREAARRNLSQGLGVRASAQDFEKELTDRGLVFTDRSGRKWDPANYAEMVTRTVSAEVANAGHINTAAELGSKYVRVSDGKVNSDQACKDANGQVWTLAYAMAHKIEHPGCRRSFAALPSTYDGKVDRGD